MNDTTTIYKKTPLWKEILFLLIKVALIILCFVLLFTFIYGALRYPDQSMSPAVKDGDLVLFYRHSRNAYLPQDVIVLKADDRRQIRRVIALAGDLVDITPEGLMINGSLQQEPEIYRRTDRYMEGISFPLIVPDGHVFVLADNRVGTEDSRIYGCVSTKDTLGKVMTVIRRRGI